MMRLPVVITPYEDELLYSYLLRLAKTAGYSSYKDFYKYCIRPNNHVRIQSKNYSRYDSNLDLTYVLSQLEPLLQDNEPISDLYRKHSFYGLIAPFLTLPQQTDWINAACRKDSEKSMLTAKINKDKIQSLKICPDCIKSSGIHYKRIHQIPGLRACPVHGTALQEYTGERGKELDSPVFTAISDDFIDEADKKYAQFVYFLLSETIETNSNEIALAIKSFLMKNGCTMNNSSIIFERAETLDRSAFCTNELQEFIQRLFRHSGHSPRRFDPEQLIRALFVLFQNPKDILHYLNTDFPSQDIFEDYASEQGYELISAYHRHVITLRHKLCGYQFITSPETFMSGWECPCCDAALEDAELFQKIFKRTYGDEYSLQSAFRGLHTSIIVMHKPCGKEYSVTPSSLLNEISVCDCDKKANARTMANARMKRYPEWKLIKIDRIGKPVTLRHLPCGHTKVFCDFGEFMRSPSCNICEPEKYIRIDYLQRLREILGNRIVMIDTFINADTELQFQCMVCGNTFRNTPRNMIKRCFCPKCSARISLSYEDMRDAVSAFSGGRYTITNKNNNTGKYTVKDIQSGSSKSMNRNQILLEVITSVSYHLPVENKQAVLEKVTAASIKVKEHLEKLRQTSGYFYYEDIDKYLTGSALSHGEFLLGWINIQSFSNYCYCAQETWGLYVFSDTVAEVNYDRMIAERYIFDDQGCRIGYFAGIKFLQDIGCCSDESNSVCVITNRVQGNGTNIVLGGITYKIKASKHGMVSDDNYGYKVILGWVQSKYFQKDRNTLEAIGAFIKEHSLARDGFDSELKTYPVKAKTRVNGLLDDIDKLKYRPEP